MGSFSEPPADALVNAAVEAAAALSLPAFEIVFERVMSFKGNEALVLLERDGAAGIAAFRAALGWALAEVGLKAGVGGRPHMTLGHGGTELAEQTVAEPIPWAAREFVLVHSLVGKGEHRHRGRRPLVLPP